MSRYKIIGQAKISWWRSIIFLVYHWYYLNPIKTSGFWMRLSGCDICKNSREPVYYILEELGRMIQRITSYKKFQSHGRQQLPWPPFALLFIMVCLLWHQLMCSSSFCGIVVLLLELLFYLRYNITLKL